MEKMYLNNPDPDEIYEGPSDEDLEQIENLDEESGEYEDFDIDTDFGDSDEGSGENLDSDEENIIKIQFEDSFGNLKEIIIKYK